MFHSTESRPALAILAVPAFALLLAGGASIQSRHEPASIASAEVTVQMAEAGVMDVSFTPNGYTTHLGSAPTIVQINAAGGMDLTFTPEDGKAQPAPESAPTATAALELRAAAGPDSTYTTAN